MASASDRPFARRSAQIAAAHLIASTAVVLLGLVAVDMPRGYLGPSESTTPIGYAIAVALLLMTTAGVYCIGHRPVLARLLVPLLYAATAGLFIPPLADDPVMAGAVATWQLYRLASWLLLPTSRRDPRDLDEPTKDRASAWRRRSGPAARHILMVSVFAAVLVVGYRAGQMLEAYLVCLALDAIAIGTLFLSFPAATTHARPIAPVEALFTATSAACVTGLVVLDTGTDLSPFGQTVVLLLIQVGGLSIMTLSAFAALLLGSRLGLRGELTLGEVLDQRAGHTTERLVRFIVVSTVVLEALGAVVLGLGLHQRGVPTSQAAWQGVFHSISAFCNAGFSLWSDSLIGFADDWLILATIALLIVLGGLGFPVLLALWGAGRRPSHATRDPQVRMVLLWSAGLVLAGALWFVLVEHGRSLADLGPGGRVVHAVFQSVTTRTAGFNSVDLTQLGPATVLLVALLMFIGASPGGTGGGIKTTTAAVLLGAIPTILRRERQVVIADRTVPLETVFRSAAITTLALLLVVGGTLVLLLTQRLARRLAHPNVLERIDLGALTTLAEVEAPESFAGHTLVDLGVRRKVGVTVVAIRRGAVTLASLEGSEVLASGDVLVVIGPEAAIERLADLA